MKAKLNLLFLMLVAGCDQRTSQQVVVIPPVAPKTARSSPLPSSKNIDAEPSRFLPDTSKQKDLIAKSDEELWASASSYCTGGELEDGMKFFATSPLFRDYEIYLFKFSRRLGSEAPEKGIEWLGKLESNYAKYEAFKQFAEGVQKTNPDLAGKIAAKLPLGPGKDAIYRGMATTMGADSVDTAVEFLKSVYSKDAGKLKVEIGGLIQSIKWQPENILRYSKEFPNCVPPETFGKALFEVWRTGSELAVAAMNDPASLPSGSGMWDSFTSEFQKVDYVGVSAWATKLPPGKVRDEVSHALARGIVMRFPVDALKWSLQIREAENRDDAISMVFNSARLHDPVGAENAFAESNISAAERAKWLSKLKGKSQ